MAATPPPNTPQTPPGWYADPGGSAQERWWDGTQWTENLRGGMTAFGPGGGQVAASEGSRGIAMLAHLSALIAIIVGFVFVGPLVVYLVKKDDPFVRAHAAEALNFNLSWVLWSLVGGFIAVILAVVTLGLGLLVIVPLAIIAAVAWFVLVIIAGIKANNGEMYRYPLTIRFVS